MKKIKMCYQHLLIIFSIIVTVSCVCAVKQASAQAEPAATAIDEIKPLKIGDKVPDELWDRYFPVVSAGNDKTQMLKLGDFRDKLIILDFWATWCAPCISSLYKLDTLQKEFKDDLMIIPTSYEPEEKVRSFFADKGWQLPTAFEETLLKAYFPYRSIPHQVWIKDGKVMSIAGSEYANKNNINKVLANEPVKMLSKIEDLNFDKRKPLLIDGNGGSSESLLYHSLVSKRIHARVAGLNESDNHLTFFNVTVPFMFREAFSDSIPFHGLHNQIIIETSDSIKQMLIPPSVEPNEEVSVEMQDFIDNHTFCYDLRVNRAIDRSKRLEFMQDDLNRFFGIEMGIEGNIETRKMKCLTLVRLDKIDRIKSKSNLKGFIKQEKEATIINNQPIGYFVNAVAAINSRLSTPIIDATDYKGNIDLKLEASLKDMESLRKELQKYGLDFKEQEREISVLVISQIK